MSIAEQTAFQIMQMLIILLVGVYMSKRNIIDDTGQEKLTALLLEIVTPLIIFTSYQKDYSPEVLTNLLKVLGVSFVSIFIAIFVSLIVIKETDKRDYIVERMAVMYSNCGFIGIPIMYALFKSDGVFYCTGFITAFNIVCWTYGIYMHRDKQKISVKTILLQRNILAIIFGLLFFLFQIRLPLFLYNPLYMISNMNAPLAFLIIGASVGHTRLSSIFGSARIYLVVFYHNLLIPFIIIFWFKLFPMNEMLAQIVLIACACPVGTTTTTFSIRFGRDAQYASRILTNSTLLSMLTIPIILLLYSII